MSRTTAKDFFLNLASLITLYVSVGSLIALLFGLINKVFPDVLNRYYFSADIEAIRISIAVLIITFPAYLIFQWLAEREVWAVPEKKRYVGQKVAHLSNAFCSNRNCPR